MCQEIYRVWEDAIHRVASFHPVEWGLKKEFTNHEHFMGYLAELQNRGFRFQ